MPLSSPITVPASLRSYKKPIMRSIEYYFNGDVEGYEEDIADILGSISQNIRSPTIYRSLSSHNPISLAKKNSNRSFYARRIDMDS